jgi:hypothetical protein
MSWTHLLLLNYFKHRITKDLFNTLNTGDLAMSTQSSFQATRAWFVVNSSGHFVDALQSAITFEQLKEFADNAEAICQAEEGEYLRYFGSNEQALINHATHMRTVAGKIVLLRDGLVPALEIDRNNPVLRLEALRNMAYIRAESEAMKSFLQ